MNKKVSNKIVGIDLGTTNSCVAISQRDGSKVISNTQEGRNTTPSVVSFKNGEKEAVGSIAKRQSITRPEEVIYEAKRLIGRKFNSKEVQDFCKIAPFKIFEKKEKNGAAWIKVGEKEYSPQQISAFVLQKMKEIAENHLGEIIQNAVITVPAYFDDSQRQATIDAAVIAGFGDKNDEKKTRQMIRIINEPTAAALAYGLDRDKKQEPQTIAVFDLGGGTFDISIIELDEEVFKVKATNGDTFLGGANFDQKIIDWLIKEFKKEQGIDLGKDKTALQRLKEAAENAKHELSSEDKKETEIMLPFISADASGPKHLSKKLFRWELEELVAELLEKLVLPCKNCLKDSKLTEVNKIILVGGMTRMPAVQKKVKEIFGIEPEKSVNPDEAVAVGAAIQGGIIAGDTKDILLLDVAPLSLGIETEGGNNQIIIPRNTTIPTKKSQLFSTAVDNQPSVHVRVIQGERPMAIAEGNKVLGTFELGGIDPAPRGVPQIEVTFDIDANGIVKVSAKDKKTNKEANITITGSSGLSKEEIERMIKEAEENKAKDEEYTRNAKTLNQAQAYCHTFEKQIEEFRKHKDFREDEPQFQEFKKLYDELKKNTEELKEEKNEEEKKRKYSELKKKLDKIDELIKLTSELEQKFSKEEEQKNGKEGTPDAHPEPEDKDKK